MKRALAIAVALCTIGFAGFSQITSITGSWTATLRVLPVVELRSSVLTLTTNIAGFDVTSTTTFGDTDEVATGLQFGYREQAFSLRGAFGPFTITGSMAFNAGVTKVRHWVCTATGVLPPVAGTWVYYDYTVTAPAYKSASLTSAFDFGGVAISMKVDHWAFPYYAELGGWPCGVQTEPYTLYTFSTTIAPVTVTTWFEDCCTGIEFKLAQISLKGVELCCGIKYDVLFSFKKTGFDFINFYVANLIQLCCNIGFDVNVQFGVEYKQVTLIPKFPGITGCLTVWADPSVTGTTWNGLTIYGYRFSCTFADCGLLEFMTVLTPPPVLPGTCDQPTWYTGAGFRTNEFEYIRVRFCGAGCCGGTWTVTGTAYFATGIQGGLFDLSRLMISASVPVMANLTLTLSVGLPMDPDVVVATGLSAGQNLFDFGIRFTF